MFAAQGPRCREAGEKPARSRHCDRGVCCHPHATDEVCREGGRHAVIRESGYRPRNVPCCPRGWSRHAWHRFVPRTLVIRRSARTPAHARSSHGLPQRRTPPGAFAGPPCHPRIQPDESRHPWSVNSPISSAASTPPEHPDSSPTCTTPTPAPSRPASRSPGAPTPRRPSRTPRRRRRIGASGTRSAARACCCASSNWSRASGTPSPACCRPSTARPSPTRTVTCNAAWRWSSSPPASRTC